MPFTVSVTPDNDPPHAENDENIPATEDISRIIDVLGNDTDIDQENEGDVLVIAGIANLDNASVEIVDDGEALLFVPDLNWNGTEEFTYTIEDEGGKQSTATVTVIVSPANDDPVGSG